MTSGRNLVSIASLAIGLALATAGTGCVTRVDMSTAYDPGRAATTIPYSGVRGSRQFPDYEAIGPSILTGVDPFAPVKGAKGAKGAKPQGGTK